ncbi:MAG: SH3 domain-containing protein [Planctomycetota bacterium]|nr:SH3 domain-containing protein [Planctomycetota bacterium]
MTLPLRYRFPIAMGLSALIVSPFLAYSAEGELQLASNERNPRPIVRAEPANTRPRASTEPREVFETPQWGQVSGQMVNLRGGAGTQYMIVATMRSGDYLRAVAKVGNWIEVDWPEAAVAWVARDFVDAEGRVTGNNVRIRTAGNLNATILGEARKGDVLTVLGSSGDWYKIKAPQGAKAYIYGRYLLLGVRAPAHAADAMPAPEPNEPAATPAAPASPSEPAEIDEPAAPAAPVVSEAQPEPAAKPTEEVHVAAAPVPALPAMELVEAPGIRMPSDAEARATERNAPPILDLIAQETRAVPVVPPVVVEPVIVDAPAPEAPAVPEAPEALKAPEEHAAAPAPAAHQAETAVTAARADTPASAPAERPAEATATRAVLPAKPPEEDLWGDELPPPKRVILPPGARRAPNDETSEAPPSAPAEREGGLIMGLLKDLQDDPQRIAVAPAEVVDLPAPKPAPAAEPVSAPEPPARPFVWKPRATRAPYLPRPRAEAPASVRLPGAPSSQVGPVHATGIASIEGVLEAVPGPVQGCAFAVRADDGSLWHLKEGPAGEAATLLGARVSAVGRLGGYPNVQGVKVLDVSSLALAR